MSHLQPSSLFSVKGLVVVLTGGGSGLGRMMAHTLDANGASKIFIIGRRKEALQETITLSPNSGSSAIIPVQADVSSKASLQAAYQTISAQTGHVDLLIANSGIIGPKVSPPPPKPDGSLPSLAEVRDALWSVPMEDFTHVLDVNVTGAYYTAIAFLPLLEAANKRRPAPVKNQIAAPTAQVIITTSIAGFNRKVPFSAAYNVSKAAANHVVKMLSEMSTPNFEDGDKGVSDGSFEREKIPLTRAGGEDDIAGLILYMASSAGSYLNGNITITDGGRLNTAVATY